MDKEVLIHVRGLQTMDADGEQEPLEIVVPGQYYFGTEVIICVMRKSWRILQNLPSIT